MKCDIPFSDGRACKYTSARADLYTRHQKGAIHKLPGLRSLAGFVKTLEDDSLTDGSEHDE